MPSPGTISGMRGLPYVGLLLCVAVTAQNRTAVGDLLEAKLIDRIRTVDAASSGVLGVFAIDLESGHTISYHGDVVFPQASSIKIPLMIEVFRQAREGKFKLNDMVVLQPADAVAGSGYLRLMLAKAVNLSIEDLVTAMIAGSDNTATNRLIAMVGMEQVNATMDKLGFRQTRLRRKMIDAEAAAKNDENVSTPREMAHLAELLYRGKAVDAESSQHMLRILKLVEADFRASIPPAVEVAAKPGQLTGVLCETGVVFVKGRPFALSVASTFLNDSSNPVPVIARAVYDYFAVLARSNRYGNGGVR
ncbi:MAG: serine hydrolase [Bryobacteraceae bacterium]|nr:serine hydrolase [Bryobacteraceae bacterium]